MTHHGNKESEFDNKESRTTILGMLATVYALNGNNFKSKYHVQPQGISGVGLTTGIRYHGAGVTQQEIKGSLKNQQYMETDINNFKIVGHGVNYKIHDNMHITVNADGETIASFDNFSSDCK